MCCEQNDMGPLWSEGLNCQYETPPHVASPPWSLCCMLTKGLCYRWYTARWWSLWVSSGNSCLEQSPVLRGLCVSETQTCTKSLRFGGYFLKLKSESESRSVVSSSLDPMDYTVHGLLQARILEWVVFPFSRESSQLRDWTQVSCIAGGFFTSGATREAQEYWSGWPIPSPVDLPDPGIELGSLALQVDSLPTELSGKLKHNSN